MGGYFNPGAGPRVTLPTGDQLRAMQREREAKERAQREQQEDEFQRNFPGVRPRASMVPTPTPTPTPAPAPAQSPSTGTPFPNASIESMKAAILGRSPEPQRGETENALREMDPARQMAAAAPAANQKWMESETARRTIRELSGADGKKTYTNQGNEGTVIMRNGESVGPDIGRPGRGGVSMPATGTNPMDDPAYRNYRANLYGSDQVADDAKAESDRKMFEILQRNPFARETIMAQIRQQQQESEAQNAYATARAKGQAEQDTRTDLLSIEADIEESYQMTLADIGARKDWAPEMKQEAMMRAEQRRDLEKRRAGIPTDASWNRLG
jgi:hypothetical protein